MSEYISESTIDSPPKESNEDIKAEQKEMFDEDKHEQEVAILLCTEMPGAFEFKLTLQLKANGQSSTIPIASGQCYSDRVEEILMKQFTSAYFLQRLRAIVGMPLKEKQQELPTENKENIPGGEDCKPFDKPVVQTAPIEVDDAFEEENEEIDDLV